MRACGVCTETCRPMLPRVAALRHGGALGTPWQRNRLDGPLGVPATAVVRVHEGALLVVPPISRIGDWTRHCVVVRCTTAGAGL
jgi:hypothetical protein